MLERLVILGSTVTALAVARDAHAHGLEPVVVDDDPGGVAFRSRRVARHVVTNVGDDAEALTELQALGGTAAALIATGDPWVRFVMRQRALLDVAFGRVLHAANAALGICLDKQRFATWCGSEGIRTPRVWMPDAQPRPAGLAFPLLVRPAQTLHGRNRHGLPKACEVGGEAALAALLGRFRAAACPALVSESLLRQRLTQYSVPFARSGDELASFVARKVRPAPERCSVGTFVELAPQPDIEAEVRRAAVALDYRGIGEAEVLHSEDTGSSWLIEINARPWQQYALALASGRDFLGLLIGRPISLETPLRTGRAWLDLHADLYGAFSRSEGAVRAGRLSLAAYVASLARANVFARFDWRDPAPALAAPRGSAASMAPHAVRGE